MNRGQSHPIKMLRGETKAYVFIYRPRNKALPAFNITGKTVEMRIKPKGGSEIVYTAVNPGCYISDAVNGKITINPTAAMKTAYAFQNADYVILLDGERLFYGPLTVEGLYGR